MMNPLFWATEHEFKTSRSVQQCADILQQINEGSTFYPHIRVKMPDFQESGFQFSAETLSRVNSVYLVGTVREDNGTTVKLVAGGVIGAMLPFIQLLVGTIFLVVVFPSPLMLIPVVAVWGFVGMGLYSSFRIMRDRLMQFIAASLQ
jgi:hypothetical protein